MVSRQMPPRKIAPVRVGVWVKIRVSFRVGGHNYTMLFVTN